MDAFVPLTTDGGRGNDGTGAKPSGRPARLSWRMLRIVVRMAVAAQPARWLWKNQIAPGNVATTMSGDDNNEKSTEDPKFRFWPNNRGDNLSKRVKNRTGRGENETLELCPRRRGKFQSSRRGTAQDGEGWGRLDTRTLLLTPKAERDTPPYSGRLKAASRIEFAARMFRTAVAASKASSLPAGRTEESAPEASSRSSMSWGTQMGISLNSRSSENEGYPLLVPPALPIRHR
jgi:hypothetical protein